MVIMTDMLKDMWAIFGQKGKWRLRNPRRPEVDGEGWRNGG